MKTPSTKTPDKARTPRRSRSVWMVLGFLLRLVVGRWAYGAWLSTTKSWGRVSGPPNDMPPDPQCPLYTFSSTVPLRSTGNTKHELWYSDEAAVFYCNRNEDVRMMSSAPPATKSTTCLSSATFDLWLKCCNKWDGCSWQVGGLKLLSPAWYSIITSWNITISQHIQCWHGNCFATHSKRFHTTQTQSWSGLEFKSVEALPFIWIFLKFPSAPPFDQSALPWSSYFKWRWKQKEIWCLPWPSCGFTYE